MQPTHRHSASAADLASIGLGAGLTAPSPEVIDEIERARVVDSLVAVAAAHGYGAVTVDRVLRHAHMSARTFYRLFDSLEDWGLAAYRLLAARLQAELELAHRREEDWPAAIRAAIAAALAFAAREPAAARFLAIEIQAGGNEARALQAESIDRLATGLREGRHLYPAAAQLHRLTEAVVVAGAVSLIGDRIRAGEAELLPSREPELVELALAPFLGAAEARRFARARARR